MAGCGFVPTQPHENERISRRLSQIVAGRELAGVTGLEAEPFCSFSKENEQFIGHVHNWAHKIWAQIVSDCRRLSWMPGSKTRRSRRFEAYEFLHSTGRLGCLTNHLQTLYGRNHVIRHASRYCTQLPSTYRNSCQVTTEYP